MVDDIMRLGMHQDMWTMLIGYQDDKMRLYIAYERPWPQVEPRSSRMTWPNVETNWLELQTIEHACTRNVCGRTSLDSE